MFIFNNKIINRILSFGLVFSFLVLCAGCESGKKNDESFLSYHCKTMDIEGTKTGLDDFKLMHIGNLNLLYGTNSLSETEDVIMHFYFLDGEGKVSNSYNVNTHKGQFMDVTMSESGDIYGVCLSKRPNENYSPEEENVNTDNDDSDTEDKGYYGMGPYTDSKNPEDKLGTGLFNRRYEEEQKRIQDLKEKRQKNKESQVSNDEDADSENAEAAFDSTAEEGNEPNEEVVAGESDELNEEVAEEGNEPNEEVAAEEGNEPNEEVVAEEGNELNEEVASEESYESDEEVSLEDSEGEGTQNDEVASDDMEAAATSSENPYSISISVNPVENSSDYTKYYGNNDYYQGEDENEIKYQKDINYFELIKISQDGKMLVDKDLFEDEDVENILGSVKGKSINALAYINDSVYLYIDGNIFQYDSDFNYKGAVLKSNVDPHYEKMEFVRNSKGVLYGWYCEEETYDVYLAEVDFETGKISNQYKMNEKYYIRLYSGNKYDFSLYKNGFLYGFNFGDKEYTKEVDFMSSDISTDNVNSVIRADENHFYSIFSSIEEDTRVIGFFSEGVDKNISDKAEISLAVVESDYNIKKAVAEFNKKNKKYKIRLIDYNAMYGENDYFASEAVIEKLNTDIIAGNMPDIISLSASLPFQTYINKGLIEDLYPYIENDSDFNIEDYNEHVLKAFSTDGKLYRLVPSYTINTLVIDRKFLNGAKTWKIEDAERIIEENNMLAFLPFVDRKEAINYVMLFSGSQFIDYNTGICNFDSDRFRKALEFIKTFPQKNDYNSPINQKLSQDYSNIYRANMVLGRISVISDLNALHWDNKSSFDDGVAYVGFPSDNGEGSSFGAEIQLAMSGISDHKEGCWEFMKYFLSEEYQNRLCYENALPIMNSVFEKMKGYAQETPLKSRYIVDGAVKTYDMNMWINGESIPLSGMTDEELNDVMDLINSTNVVSQLDNKVMKILYEETEDYYNGRATIEEVTNRIQSRVQIYLYETQ